MNPIAIIIDNRQIHWDLILILLAIPAWFFQFHSLYAAGGGRRVASWLFLPVSLVFALFSSRMLFWYTHIEQYSGLSEALSDRSTESFSLLGILPGLFLAALLLRLVHLSKDLPAMLDALSPATAMGLGLLYLTDLFNTKCRGKFLVEAESMHHLPFASAVSGTGGETEYRFATFFISFILLALIAWLCSEFYFARRAEHGMTACLFLLLFSCSEFVLDSTRYDPEYFPFNGFVSILQIFAGLSVLGLGIFFSIRALKRRRFHWYFIPLWIGLLGSMTACGIMEYLVQRYSDKHSVIYIWMSVAAAGMALFNYILYALGRKLKRAALRVSDADADAATTEASRLPLPVPVKKKKPALAGIREDALEELSEEMLERMGE